MDWLLKNINDLLDQYEKVQKELEKVGDARFGKARWRQIAEISATLEAKKTPTRSNADLTRPGENPDESLNGTAA